MKGRWLAAVLACGPGALLSHRSAADLWGLRPTARARIDVTARPNRRPRGVDGHSSRTLRPADATQVQGIPCTTVARTLLDLAGLIDRKSLERAIERAEQLRLFDGRAISELLARAAGRRGAATLRTVLAENRIDATFTRSELERRFLALCAAGGLPRPRVNSLVETRKGVQEVDFLWPAERLAVETDGYETHSTRRAFELDRERDRRLVQAGSRVVRFTWRQVDQTPAEVAEALSELLRTPDRAEPD